MKTESRRAIQGPKFPKRLPAGSVSALMDDGEYSAMELAGCRLAEPDAARTVFESVVFRKVVLGPSRHAKPRFTDCRFKTSDLSGADWEQARFRRTEFLDCRLIGAQFVEAEFEDILFADSNFERAVFCSAKFRAVRFRHCSLREASFENADLARAVFEECDLAGADLRLARLCGADLRGSRLDGVQAGPQEFKGAVVDSAQAVQLAGLLGIVVREKGEDPEL
jgi:uncharacterized protein YjbI with pentapeptide repeats